MADIAISESACKNTHKVVDGLIPGGKLVVLDIPSGEGAFSRRLMDRGVEVYSADVVRADLADNPRFQVADMNGTLPFENGKFDGVVCIDGIEHIERQFDFARECCRVTKSGGFIIISTPNISSLRSRFRWLLTGFHTKCKTPLNERCPHPSHHINMISFPELRYILHTCGFSIQTLSTNRIKFVSWFYAPLALISFLNTLYWFRKEAKNDDLKLINRQMLAQMFSLPVLFGETLIVKAIKR